MSLVTVIGSLNYDLVTYTDKVPAGGETFLANSFENHLGGKGLNEAIATSRLFDKSGDGHVRMIGNIGDDSFGKELKQSLQDNGVDIKFVKTIEGLSSGVAVILVETNGENRILITSGANGELKPTNEDYENYFKQSKSMEKQFVILQNEYPDTIKSIQWIKQNRPGINIAYNPSPYKPELITADIWKLIDLLIVNEGEALDVGKNLLSAQEFEEFQKSIEKDNVKGFSELSSKLQKLINQDNASVIIITMGSSGSIYTSKEIEPKFHKANKIGNVVDTTGAGDTFFGGVVSQLASGNDLHEAIKFANTASGLVIQKKGAAESIPTIEEVRDAMGKKS